MGTAIALHMIKSKNKVVYPLNAPFSVTVTTTTPPDWCASLQLFDCYRGIMAIYKNVELRDELVAVVRHMNHVEQYRETLQGLQAIWDNLTLLGQLSGTGTEMSATRQAFSRLTADLLNRLGEETLKKCIEEMSAKAQVAIDILVRNLFERTADIGFLATDDDLRRFLGSAADTPNSLPESSERVDAVARIRQRFAEYAAKYSVYSDIVLLDPNGNVLARHDTTVKVTRSEHPLVKAALSTRDAYVENFGKIDLLPECPRALVYSYRVCDDAGVALGVLCLCFRFENEMERIFASLVMPDDWSVIILLDSDGSVIASSDTQHIPLGVRFRKRDGAHYRIERFAGREYLATTCPTRGYQGYRGPGWLGQVMLPIQHAFEQDASQVLRGIDADALRTVMSNSALFGEELRGIPLQADRIQRELNRSVWNGNVRQRSERTAGNPSFSKVLLWEISKTGNRTKDVFARSIANLHATVVSSILNDSRFFASLAIDIMDRNLYERANDCRWWAQSSDIRQLLAHGEFTAADAQRIAEKLQTINSLYTVYANIVVFDRDARLVAVAQADPVATLGQPLRDDWVRQVLALPDAQGYAVSDFVATPLYDERPTYVYGAAIRAPDSDRVVGGIGVVFDSAPQFTAMLHDALPRDRSGQVARGTFSAFVERSGRVIASTDSAWQPGDMLPLAPAVATLDSGSQSAGIALIGDSYYAIGARMSSGYREYKTGEDPYRNDVAALVCVPLCSNQAAQQSSEIRRPVVRADESGREDRVEIATFLVGHKWFGLDARQIVESVDFTGIATAPGAGKELAGYLMYQDAPIAVFDIRPIVDTGAPSAAVNQQVIVVHKEGYARFGILVDDLGEIPEILASRLHPVPDLAGGGNILADSIVMTDKPESETLLVVLSADRIARRLVGPPTKTDDRLPPPRLEVVMKV